jgi:hypothetical protein
MNIAFSPGSVRWLLLLVLSLACVALCAGDAMAAELSSEAFASSPILQASILHELVGNRARLIQVSLVIVAFGCAIMWWIH